MRRAYKEASAAAFLGLALSSEGQAEVESVGYVQVPSSERDPVRARLEEATR